MTLKMQNLALCLLLLLTACGGSTPSQPQGDLSSRIVRIGERKSGGIYFSIDDRIPDNKEEIWRVSFLKIFRESGNIYTYLQLRVDPRYNYAVSSSQPLRLTLGNTPLNITNDSKDKDRVGLYKVDAKTLSQGPLQLTIPIVGKDPRTLVIGPEIIKGWQAVDAITNPNDFNTGTVTESK